MNPLIALVASLAVCLALPTEYVGQSDPEYKPVAKPATAAPVPDDEYAPIHAGWTEPKPVPEKPLAPQTGSLLQLELEQIADPNLAPKDPTASVPVLETPPGPKIEDIPVNNTKPTANAPQNHYPIPIDTANLPFKESSEKVAAIPVPDPQKKDLQGVNPPPVIFDRPEVPHPMEAKTPLYDNAACDPDRVLEVSVVSAVQKPGEKYATLPSRFGCSSYKDSSREKISPSVKWSNVAADAYEFSLQMIDMGDNCMAKGPEYGAIMWHVTGMKAASEVTLPEGASHDSRLLRGGSEHVNQWLEEYYSGPCPPAGTTGCYRVKVLAHRANGVCQCGFQDILFTREAKPVQQ